MSPTLNAVPTVTSRTAAIVATPNGHQSAGIDVVYPSILSRIAARLYARPLDRLVEAGASPQPAEKTVTELPAGPLYWHVENFPALADAEAAAGPLSLATEVEGKVWLFTLGPKGTPTHGGSMVTEIGPLVDVSAPEYLLSINHGVAAPGAKSEVHTHPGTEAFFVLEGQLSQQTPHGVNIVEAGKTLAGGPAEHPMEVTSSGGEKLHWLIMFVLDANKPFASEATFE